MIVGVVGLGYVGLPLALALAEHHDVVAFDVSKALIEALWDNRDPSGEVSSEQLAAVRESCVIRFTVSPADLKSAKAVIIAVPTPIDETRRPDLSALESATETVAREIGHGTLVVYESTVYPGCTEDRCLPILQRMLGLRDVEDLDLAYSPERVVPGDATRTVTSVPKLVAGQTERALLRAMELYGCIVDKLVPCSSIRVAEAAKVLENTQRDLNIALMNECALIFERAGLDTNEVIDAACTKWNFHDYRPGLVGGHCIGVDPYYLTHMAELLGYRPEVILAGRRINDSMGTLLAQRLVREMLLHGQIGQPIMVGILGLTFKENVSDLRNSRVLDLVRELRRMGSITPLHDPHAADDDVYRIYGYSLSDTVERCDALVVAVPHDEYRNLSAADLAAMCTTSDLKPVLLDVRGIYPKGMLDDRFHHIRL